MREMLTGAGFVDVTITVKENAEEIIKGWMPGSGAEKYVTSAYVTARKPTASWGFRDSVTERGSASASASTAAAASASGSSCCAPPVAAPAQPVPVAKPAEKKPAEAESGKKGGG